MNIEELVEGRIFKNYGDMCRVLGIDSKAGKAKIYQIREIERYCKMKKDGHSIIVVELYDPPLQKIDRRGLKRFNIPLKTTHPILYSKWCEELNGYAVPEDMTKLSIGYHWWGCNICDTNSYSSLKKILGAYGELLDGNRRCQYCSMSKGEKVVADILNNRNVKYTTEYMYDDLKGDSLNLRFDFAVLNEQDNVLYHIEYDGEFHYYAIYGASEDAIRTLISNQEYDSLKNNYCLKNNISLLRIPFFELENTSMKINNFISMIDSSSIFISILPIDDDVAKPFIIDRVDFLSSKIKDSRSNIILWENEINEILKSNEMRKRK